MNRPVSPFYAVRSADIAVRVYSGLAVGIIVGQGISAQQGESVSDDTVKTELNSAAHLAVIAADVGSEVFAEWAAAKAEADLPPIETGRFRR